MLDIQIIYLLYISNKKTYKNFYRGYSCPLPVVMTKREIEKSNSKELEVMVDNQVSLENVTRYAKSNGFDVYVKNEGDDFKLILKKH